MVPDELFRPYDGAELRVHRPVERFPTGSSRGSGREKAIAAPGSPRDQKVRDPFELSVVYLTTDAMPSRALVPLAGRAESSKCIDKWMHISYIMTEWI